MSSPYELASVVGEGAFATIWKCIHAETNAEYAIKIAKSVENITEKERSEDEAFFRHEAEVLRILHHANIIRFVDVVDEPDQLGIVLELATDGDLFDYIVHGQPLSEHDGREIARDAVSAVQYLASKSIVHRDIKLENFLLFKNNGRLTTKLGDFGLAVYTNGDLDELCGSPSYVAPEILGQQKYGLPVDVWSAGVILFAIMSQCLPFIGNTRKDLYRNIKEGELDFPIDYWCEKSDLVKNLLRKMLTVNVQNRIEAGDLLSHEWFTMELEPDSPEQSRRTLKMGLKTTAKIVGKIMDLHNRVQAIKREKALRNNDLLKDLNQE